MEDLNPEEIALRFNRSRLINSDGPDHEINGDTYNQYIMETETHDSHISAVHMTVDESFHRDVITALAKEMLNRATGIDGISTELLLLTPHLCSTFIYRLWKQVGMLAHVPSGLTQGYVIPLFKKGDATQPRNYRPITLLSHVRKIISIAVNIRLNRQYKFNINQYRFSPNCGTKMATLQAHNLAVTGHKYLAVIDLKQAYPSVRRNILPQQCGRRLPNNDTYGTQPAHRRSILNKGPILPSNRAAYYGNPARGSGQPHSIQPVYG